MPFRFEPNEIPQQLKDTLKKTFDIMGSEISQYQKNMLNMNLNDIMNDIPTRDNIRELIAKHTYKLENFISYNFKERNVSEGKIEVIQRNAEHIFMTLSESEFNNKNSYIYAMIYLYKNVFNLYTNIFSSIENPDNYISYVRNEQGFLRYILSGIKTLLFGQTEKQTFRNISIYSTLSLLFMIWKSISSSFSQPPNM